jgi:penicillin amidase
MTNTSRAAAGRIDEILSIPGLAAEAEICVDLWGVPHIRAASLTDLFFVQGFNAARDRLWQIDLARKRGLGLLAGDFGPGFLAQDRAARLFLYRGEMKVEWSAYGADAKEICTAFAKGINAYVDLVPKEPVRLPPEFTVLGTKPAKWAPEDVVRIRTHAWLRNAVSEILRAGILSKADAETDLLRTNLEPLIQPHVADGLDLASIPLQALDVYRLAVVPVIFNRDRLGASIEQVWGWSKVTPAGEVIFDQAAQGSNNWTISATRTAAGRPILANDPHRAHAAPSLRYMVHLAAPGFDAIGAGEAVLPGIMMGHNGDAAFGLTLFFGDDEEDVYVYETRPGNPNEYKYQNGWEAMQVVEEAFAVKGAPEQMLTMKFTRHGPVVFEDFERNRAYAVRTVATEPGTAPYAASLISMRSRGFEEFRAAMRYWGTPSVNQVYADRGGTIGWISAGFNPCRENWDGLLPVPGDGRYEWKGFIDSEHLPWVKNPAAGFFATANEMNWPANWPHRPPAFEWWENSRATRIRDVLGGQTRHSVADSQILQTDTVSMPAIRLKAILASLRCDDPDASSALTVMRSWDGRVTAESGSAALFELWWSQHLKPALFAKLVPDAPTRELMLPGDTAAILGVLDAPGPRFGSNPRSTRDRLVLETLAAAWRDAVSRLGANPSSWAWGRLHHGYFSHAVTPVSGKPAGHGFDVGPLIKGGSDSTPMLAAYRPTDFRVMLGASVRMIVDVGEWDNSVWINAPGQSGDPRSAHYADLAPLWAKGEYVPMLYTKSAVDQVVERRIVLRPAAKKGA